MQKLDISKITQCRLSPEQFFNEKHTKRQIYLHHTAGGGDAKSVARYFNKTTERVATAFIVGNSGEIVQCFSSQDWAYHLGLKSSIFTKHKLVYRSLDKTSVGIEICNWGPLRYSGGKYYNYVGGEVLPKDVIKLDSPFKKHLYWQKYTPEQIESTRQLLDYLCNTYDIPRSYNEDIFDISLRALKGEAGIYTHNSVRTDKSDIFPQPDMVEMLKNL